MKYTKKNSISLIITAAMVLGVTANCIASEKNIIPNTAEEIKTNSVQEKVILDKTPAMEDYIAQSRKRIKNNWYPPTKSFEHKATIVVTLDKSGELLDCKLLEPSEDEGFNESLIKAVKKTKFSPLPDEIQKDSIDIDFTFNMQKRGINRGK